MIEVTAIFFRYFQHQALTMKPILIQVVSLMILLTLTQSCRLKRLILKDPTEDSPSEPKEKGFNLTAKESKAFFSIMKKTLSKELKLASASGTDSVSGIFECQTKPSKKVCWLRTRIPNEENISDRKQLTHTMTSRVYEFIETYERKLRYEPFLIVTVVCNETPGSGKNDCLLSDPRLPNEYIFSNQESIEVAGMLKGNQSFVHLETIWGSLQCKWTPTVTNHQCILSPVQNDVQKNIFHKMPPTLSEKVSSELRFMTKYFNLYHNEVKQREFHPPEEILTQISCKIDFRPGQSKPHQNTRCKASI